jgi:hypothetical protein
MLCFLRLDHGQAFVFGPENDHIKLGLLIPLVELARARHELHVFSKVLDALWVSSKFFHCPVVHLRALYCDWHQELPVDEEVEGTGRKHSKHLLDSNLVHLTDLLLPLAVLLLQTLFFCHVFVALDLLVSFQEVLLEHC